MSEFGSRSKIRTRAQLRDLLPHLRERGEKIVFTNGCFDLIHPGHVRYLERAREQGDVLVVALNSDASVRRIKGGDRPILAEEERCEIVAALGCVDFVTVFGEETPLQIIDELAPDVLVKGGDWPFDQIVGRQSVESHGGKVISLAFEDGFSTTSIIERIRRAAARPVELETGADETSGH
jgi:rfaE bifunctional protein nucleotidyltransferase chain/domain